jgi:putative transcriptional regulator
VRAAPESGPDIRGIPRPLHPYIVGKPAFRFLAPGVQHIPLSLKANDVPARLVKFNPGLEVPPHHHRGLEMILVLDGEFEDYQSNDRYQTGDVSRRDETKDHRTRVTGNDACTVLIVGTELSQPLTAWGKLVQILTRL